MGFLLFCFLFSLVVQCICLWYWKEKGCLIFRWVALIMLDGFPLAAVGYYGLFRPDSFFVWEFQAVICLWIAGAFLLGNVVGWLLFVAVGKKR